MRKLTDKQKIEIVEKYLSTNHKSLGIEMRKGQRPLYKELERLSQYCSSIYLDRKYNKYQELSFSCYA
jgi:hypothetical protein